MAWPILSSYFTSFAYRDSPGRTPDTKAAGWQESPSQSQISPYCHGSLVSQISSTDEDHCRTAPPTVGCSSRPLPSPLATLNDNGFDASSSATRHNPAHCYASHKVATASFRKATLIQAAACQYCDGISSRIFASYTSRDQEAKDVSYEETHARNCDNDPTLYCGKRSKKQKSTTVIRVPIPPHQELKAADVGTRLGKRPQHQPTLNISALIQLFLRFRIKLLLQRLPQLLPLQSPISIHRPSQLHSCAWAP